MKAKIFFKEYEKFDEMYFKMEFHKQNPTRGIFPSEEDLKYLTLKLQGKKRKEIIRIMGWNCYYPETGLRRYIMKKMECNSITKAVIKAYKLGWIDVDNQNNS